MNFLTGHADSKKRIRSANVQRTNTKKQHEAVSHSSAHAMAV